jgi:hypothetical protein
MIIVTSSASEAAELGLPNTMGGIAPFVAPLAPLVLALEAVLRARRAWLDPYGRAEALRSIALASFFVLVALTLLPLRATW